jgi:class 3 adenylate cyclase
MWGVPRMMPLRTIVLMKTDMAGSTPAFRTLLAADRQTLLQEQRSFVTRHAGEFAGRILEAAGDGYWLEFPSVTAAAKSAIAMQEALRLAQPNKGDDRVAIRIVIGLGDIALVDGAMIGDTVPLVVRIEGITPADEIYLTSAAQQALIPAEVQTALVDSFMLKGFSQAVTVYRVQQRHRTRIIDKAYILYCDLRGFGRLVDAEPWVAVERVLDDFATLTTGAARKFGGTMRSSLHDNYWITFPEASQVIEAAEWLGDSWNKADPGKGLKCGINIAVHRGMLRMFRSFLFGIDMSIVQRVQEASTQLLAAHEGGIFVTGTVHGDLRNTPWYNRLKPVTLSGADIHFPGLDVYRLDSAMT